MEKPCKQALMYAENLTLPSVIVISANLGCDHCQERVSQIMSKMTGLREYTVDVRNKQVMVKGDVEFSCSIQERKIRVPMKNSIQERNIRVPMKKLKKNNRLSFKFSSSFLRPSCITGCFA